MDREEKSMCFSAAASFVTAGVTGAIGAVALTRVNEPRELPLAATPILFALQQSIEGLLWLNLPIAPGGIHFNRFDVAVPFLRARVLARIRTDSGVAYRAE
jgi:hypothetical protein